MIRGTVVVFLCLLAVQFIYCVSSPEGLRLIETQKGRRQWVTQQQLVDMTSRGYHLFDVTDFPTLGPKQDMWEPIIPTQCYQQALVNELITELNVNNLFDTITQLSSYHTRYYEAESAVDAARWLFSKYQQIIDDSSSTIASVQYFNNTWAQPSIIARIEADPTSEYADEVVILGGHIDSIISGQSSVPPYPRSPGADDDASGSSNVLEVFRVLVEQNFQGSRAIEFHGYSAEEVGLRGSQAIAESYQAQNIKVAGMLQLDMTAYPDMVSGPQLRMINDYNNADLMNFLKVISTTYSAIPWYNSQCGYACSDHASWNKTGFYSCRVKENGNYAQIHTVDDVISNVWLPYSIEFCKVSLGFLVEMSLDVGPAYYYKQ